MDDDVTTLTEEFADLIIADLSMKDAMGMLYGFLVTHLDAMPHEELMEMIQEEAPELLRSH